MRESTNRRPKRGDTGSGISERMIDRERTVWYNDCIKVKENSHESKKHPLTADRLVFDSAGYAGDGGSDRLCGHPRAPRDRPRHHGGRHRARHLRRHRASHRGDHRSPHRGTHRGTHRSPHRGGDPPRRGPLRAAGHQGHPLYRREDQQRGLERHSTPLHLLAGAAQ